MALQYLISVFCVKYFLDCISACKLPPTIDEPSFFSPPPILSVKYKTSHLNSGFIGTIFVINFHPSVIFHLSNYFDCCKPGQICPKLWKGAVDIHHRGSAAWLTGNCLVHQMVWIRWSKKCLSNRLKEDSLTRLYLPYQTKWTWVELRNSGETFRTLINT